MASSTMEAVHANVVSHEKWLAARKEFLAKENPLPANLHLVIDPNYSFTNQYGLRWDAPHETAYPSTFLIDRQGTVFFRKVSHEHGDRTTAEDVLAELERDKAAHAH